MNFYTSRGSAATLCRWGEWVYNFWCQVSLRCCIPKIITLHAKLSRAVLLLVLSVCLQWVGGRRVFVCLWVCYHN